MPSILSASLWVAALVVLGGCTAPRSITANGDSGSSTVQSYTGYTIYVDPETPSRLTAQLDLPRKHNANRTVFVRGMNFGLASQVSSPSCDGTELTTTHDGQWNVPDDCLRLSWLIELQDAIPNSVDSSAQNSLYFPDAGWWLLSEPTSLLRLSNNENGALLSLRIEGLLKSSTAVGATQIKDSAWRLPPIGSAPEFFAFGNLSLQRHDVGRVHTTYVIDDNDRFRRLPLLELHKRALEYLADVYQVPMDLPDRDRHLLVVWLGIDESHGEAGGAAGSRSFLANYIDGDEGNLSLNAARTMLVLSHEQAHQLHDLMWRGGPPVSTWVGESMAHYYGLKALARSGLPDDVVEVPMKVFIDPRRTIEAGLVEYNRRHDAGDPEAYGMFYLQGATFWAEVDRLLLAASSEQDGLDALIPEFLRSSGTGDGLPASFQALLLERGGPEMRALLSHFVGD